MLNFRQLKSFVAVAENKSFTRAAADLFMTQPAVSAQIKTLEESLEIQLLERQDKKVILTEAGQLFYHQAVRLISVYEEAITALDELRGVRRGRLIIGASTIPGEYIMPRYIGSFKDKYPGVNVTLKIADTGAVIEALRERKIDIGVTGAKTNDKDINFREFLTDELIVIAHPNSPLAGKKISLEQILQNPLILRESGSGTRMVIINHLRGKNISENDLPIAMELGSTRAVITAVESNLGISIVSGWAAEEALQLGKIIRLHVPELEIRRSLYITTHRNRYFGFAANSFLKFLQQPLL